MTDEIDKNKALVLSITEDILEMLVDELPANQARAAFLAAVSVAKANGLSIERAKELFELTWNLVEEATREPKKDHEHGQ